MKINRNRSRRNMSNEYWMKVCMKHQYVTLSSNLSYSTCHRIWYSCSWGFNKKTQIQNSKKIYCLSVDAEVFAINDSFLLWKTHVTVTVSMYLLLGITLSLTLPPKLEELCLYKTSWVIFNQRTYETTRLCSAWEFSLDFLGCQQFWR